MVQRIPHPRSNTEVRQAFQQIAAQSDVITTGAIGEILVGAGINVAPTWIAAGTSAYILVGQGVGTSPVWQILSTAVDHGSIGGLTDVADHPGYLLVDGTRALSGDMSLGSNDLTSVGLYGGVNVPTMNGFFNGTFQETFDAVVTSDGATVTMSLEQSGTGDLTMQFSDGYTTLDCTDPLQTIALTAGTDTSPQANYIYIPQSTKVLTKNTSTWPAGECIRVAYFLVPSATFVQNNGCYINQNWNDHLASVNLQGHMAHMSEKLRRLGATWFSGVNPNGATASYFTIGAGTTHWLSTSGEVDQLHEHTYPAVDTSGSDIALVVNQSGAAYDDITDLYSITDDNTGTTITNNRYFNLVFWGVVNKSGEFAALMVNLPGGFYVKAADAAIDADGHDVYDEPREFSIDSGTAFLICRATFQMGATWTHVATTDLRGLTPATASGSSVNDHGGLGGLTDVADHPAYLLMDGTRNLEGNLAVDAAITIDGRDLSVDGTKLDGIETAADVTDATNVAAAGAAMTGGAHHDGFSDFVANEHINHTAVTLTASTGLTGGGTIAANRSFSLSHLGIEDLLDAGADKLLFWDDGASKTDWATPAGTANTGASGSFINGTTATINAGYVSRGDPSAFDFLIAALTVDATWRDLDVSSIVPAGAYAVQFQLFISGGAGNLAGIRPNGNSNARQAIYQYTQVNGITIGMEGFVPCDSDRICEYYGVAGLTLMSIVVKGWLI